MSTTYTAFREAVRLAVVSASGLHDAAVVWDHRGHSVADPLVVLSVVSDVRTNDVPVRETLEESGDDLAAEYSEMRDVSVQIKVESVAGDAASLANLIQLRLHRQTAQALLRAECVPVDDGPLRDHRYSSRGLTIQARSFELLARIVLVDTDPTPVGTIETVLVQGTDIEPNIGDLSEETIAAS